jgi:hypothetical protein
VIYGNLAGAVWEQRGSRAALEILRDGVAFCEERGMSQQAITLRGSCLDAMAQLGDTEAVLAEIGSIAERIEASGDKDFMEPRVIQLRLLAERGTPAEDRQLDAFLAQVRSIGDSSRTAWAITPCLQSLLVGGRRNRAMILKEELARLVEDEGAVIYGDLLPTALRAVLALDDLDLARRLAGLIQPGSRAARLALDSAHALLLEAGGDLGEASRSYAGAADGWEAFGNVPEEAYARLGLGRSLAALSDSAAPAALTRARDLFAMLGYAPAVAAADQASGARAYEVRPAPAT